VTCYGVYSEQSEESLRSSMLPRGSLRCSAVGWRKSHRLFNLVQPVAGLTSDYFTTDALTSLSVNSKRRMYSRRSSPLDEANFHSSAPPVASPAKSFPGPADSNPVPTTLPARSTWTLTPTLIVP